LSQRPQKLEMGKAIDITRRFEFIFNILMVYSDLNKLERISNLQAHSFDQAR
jgi:hypothetical protein